MTPNKDGAATLSDDVIQAVIDRLNSTSMHPLGACGWGKYEFARAIEAEVRESVKARDVAPTARRKDLNKLLGDFARACAFGDDQLARLSTSKAIHEYFDAALTTPPGSDAPTSQPDGYAEAFYKISSMLGIPALAMSPAEGFEKHLLPRLEKLLAALPVSEAAPGEPNIRDALQSAVNRIEDMLAGDDGQAWKEARKALPALKAALATPAQAPTGWQRMVRMPINLGDPPVHRERWIPCTEDAPGAVAINGTAWECTLCGGTVDLTNAKKPSAMSMQGRSTPAHAGSDAVQGESGEDNKRLADFLMRRQTHLGSSRASCSGYDRNAWDDYASAAHALREPSPGTADAGNVQAEASAKERAWDRVRRSCVLRDAPTTIGALADTMDGVLAIEENIAAPSPTEQAKAGKVEPGALQQRLRSLIGDVEKLEAWATERGEAAHSAKRDAAILWEVAYEGLGVTPQFRELIARRHGQDVAERFAAPTGGAQAGDALDFELDGDMLEEMIDDCTVLTSWGNPRLDRDILASVIKAEVIDQLRAAATKEPK